MKPHPLKHPVVTPFQARLRRNQIGNTGKSRERKGNTQAQIRVPKGLEHI